MLRNKKIALLICLLFVCLITVGCISSDEEFDGSKIVKLDSDNDGVFDDKDDFPLDPAASIDSDNDSFPDQWNVGKNEEDSNSNLTLDAFDFDPAASVDSDDDGYPDYWNPGMSQKNSTSIPPLELDEYPDDSKAHKDTDKDGVADYYDIYDYADLSIQVTLEHFKVTNRVDILKWAQIYFEIQVGARVEKVKNNGGRWWVLLNQKQKVDYTLDYDIPDNTENEFTDIKIIMYDYDFFKEPDIVDISNIDFNGDTKNLNLRFDNTKNTISFDGVSQGSSGIVWYNIRYTAESEPDIETVSRSYSWKYENSNYNLDVEIPKQLYTDYVESTFTRNPQNEFNSNSKIRHYVTTNDEVVKEISNRLSDMADDEGFNREETANFVLKFVQYNIAYELDEDTKGCIEYWRFPVETLVEQKGDCEDTSVLYSAILDNLGYDTVLFFYSWEEDDGELFGHLSVGVYLPGDHGDYIEDEGKNYYYCETTNKAFNLGEIPSEPTQINDGPSRIIHI